jgi:glycosyltransferase involved in cell wall biosynthesis
MSAAAISTVQNSLSRIEPAAEPIRITFVVTGLDVGGAEMMLWKLLSKLDRTRFEPSLISLSSSAIGMLPAFDRLGVHREVLGWGAAHHAITRMGALARTLRRFAPDIVQGWMYHGNIAATVATRLARLNVPVLWNIRATLMERRHEKLGTALMIRLGGLLSFSPARIINNSAASAVEHEVHRGYLASKRVILPNGFDTERFRPCAGARLALRQSLGLAQDALLIGLVARYHPMKDHATFLHAAGFVARAHPEAQFVLVGEGVSGANAELASLVAKHGLDRQVHMLGPREDVQTVVAALDIQVSASSSGEGFPNVIGEAMSCGVPCVVTDVGDSAAVIDDTGVSVSPRDPSALAAGITRLIELGPGERAELGSRARVRAVEAFSLDAVVRQYEALYRQLYDERRSA